MAETPPAPLADAQPILALYRRGPNQLELVARDSARIARQVGLVGELIARRLGTTVRMLGYATDRDERREILAFGRILVDADLAVAERFLAELPSRTYADCLRERGPVLGELPWADLGADTPPALLKRWALAHYRAAGIRDPASLHEVRISDDWDYTHLPVAAVRRAASVTLIADRVAAYAELLAAGVDFPPIILRRSGHLREGYHRLAAHVAVGRPTIAAVRFA